MKLKELRELLELKLEIIKNQISWLTKEQIQWLTGYQISWLTKEQIQYI